MIGMTRSRVSFFVYNFRKLSLVDYNGNGQFNADLANKAAIKLVWAAPHRRKR
jgi:hypothetical protein